MRRPPVLRRQTKAWPLKARRKREEDLLFGDFAIELAFASRGSGGRYLRHLVMLHPSQRGLRSGRTKALHRLLAFTGPRIAVEN